MHVSSLLTTTILVPLQSIELFWENKFSDERKLEDTIPPRGGALDVKTFVGHEFSYEHDGTRHFVLPPAPKQGKKSFVLLAGSHDEFRVQCELQRALDIPNPHLEIAVRPYWAPRGASRFLELVRAGYYDGVALNRVVKQFLVQFGIAKDHETKMKWDEMNILDDAPDNHQFEPGFISFAGNGPDSRTTEIFIVMPGASREQLDSFGENSWETPFAYLINAEEDGVLSEIYSGYGDMPPWGKGPDPEAIYEEDGYEYLADEFPDLDYIERCYIVDEDDVGDEL